MASMSEDGVEERVKVALEGDLKVKNYNPCRRISQVQSDLLQSLSRIVSHCWATCPVRGWPDGRSTRNSKADGW